MLVKPMREHRRFAGQRGAVVAVEPTLDQLRKELEQWPAHNRPGVASGVALEPAIPAADDQLGVGGEHTLSRQLVEPPQHRRVQE